MFVTGHVGYTHIYTVLVATRLIHTHIYGFGCYTAFIGFSDSSFSNSKSRYIHMNIHMHVYICIYVYIYTYIYVHRTVTDTHEHI